MAASAPTRRPSLAARSLALTWLVASLWMLHCSAESPNAAETTGTLAGRLTDTHSIPLSEAIVVLSNLTTGATVSGVTGRNGSYRFTGLGPGEYRLEADVPKLGKGAVDGILVSAGHATRVQAALRMELPEPPEPDEQPDPADSRELDPVAAAVTTTLPKEELQSVPVSSRDWQAFEAITPAANPSPPSGSRGGGQIGDADEDEAASQPNSEIGPVTIETVSEIDGVDAPPAFHLQGDRSERLSQTLGTSAVQSMQARTGDAAANQSSAVGGSVDLVTNHGRNGLHGQLFYTNRQGLWGARNPFTQWVQQTAPANGTQIATFAGEPYTPDEVSQTFGLGLGRQIRRDQAFWFAALDGLLRSDPAVATVRQPASFFQAPTDPELTALAARLGLPSTDPVDEAVKAYSSGPAGLETLAGLLGPVARSVRQWQGFGRLDWQLTERQHLSVEGEGASLDAPGGGLSRSSETYGSSSFGNSHGADAWVLGRWSYFLSADLLNSAAVQFRRHVQSDSAQTPSGFERSLLAYSESPLPEIVADSKYGFILGQPARLGGVGGTKAPDERLLSAQDGLSWVHGPHLIRAGGSFDHVSDALNVLVNQSGTYDYADLFNFISDASTYLAQQGFGTEGTAQAGQHNCDASGRVPVSPTSDDTGIGPYPCYAWYAQRIGPADWHLSTNDLAGFATEQWQPVHNLTLSAGVRVQAQQLPPAIASVANSDLPATQRLPAASLQWGPRIGVAWSGWKGGVIRAGAGIYFGRIDNSSVLAALTQTGSLNGDLNYFFKPTDVGAPPFPYVFPEAPQTAIKPGAVFFAPHFKPQEVDQAVLNIEQELPSHWVVSVSAMASLGRRLPVSVDTNLAPAVDGQGKAQTITYNVSDVENLGPIKAATITVPLYTARTDTNYQQLAEIEDRANSTYEAGLLKISRYGGKGLSVHAHYLFAHAADWNPNESGQVAGNDVFDPEDFRLEYGASNLDIRHSAGATLIYRAPWKLHDWGGYLANGWSVAAVGQFRSGLPFTMRTGGYIPGYYNDAKQLIEGVGPGMNGSAGDNRVYGIGRNTYRYPATWKADTRLAKRFSFAHNRQLELFGESFNLFNHENVTLIETTGYIIDRGSTSGGAPTFTFLTGPTATTKYGGAVEFGKPVDVNATNFYRPREFQVGLRMRF